MENKKNANCKCPYLKCKRHGDCKACAANHKIIKPYCKRPVGSFGKWMVDKMFGVKK